MISSIIKLNMVILLLFGGWITTSCSGVEDAVPTGTITDSTEDLDMDDLIKTGQFASFNGYTVNGKVELFYNATTDNYSLVMSDFFSSNGPDLKVYLSQGATPNNFLNLGALKSTNGVLRYDFSGESFDPLFDNVIIWCEDFSVTFGRTVLSDP